MRYDRKKDISPKYLLLTFTIICVAFLVISFFAGDKIAFVKKYTNIIISPIQQGINKIGVWTDSKIENLKEIEELNKENEELQKEIDSYKEQITIYQEKLSELDELRALYELDESYPEYNKTVAHVFAKDSTSWFSIFYIDKGLDDGLFVGANVMCHDGLAGIITECYDDYSKVRAIIDDNSNISAKIMPSNALCTIEGNLNTYQNGVLVVKNIDKDAKITIGDKVVTSHISERFHQGITVGYISEITYDTNNLTITAAITPAVDFNNISEVLVITDSKKNVD
ncbi:MAG: rod shape-determining protein MreC [Lachnospiraceae bacterium]|nr:rod shape-determining protein MreC [Lachnospiraceae bacterium]